LESNAIISLNDIYWAAGFLEGEGSFLLTCRSPFITASQVEKTPLVTIQELFGGTIRLKKRPPDSRFKDISIWTIHGKRSIGLMMTIFHLMSPKRQEQIKKVIKVWKLKRRKPKTKTHCPNGHKYTFSNTEYLKNGHRRCIVCRRLRNAAYMRRKRINISTSSKSQLSFQYGIPGNISNE